MHNFKNKSFGNHWYFKTALIHNLGGRAMVTLHYL